MDCLLLWRRFWCLYIALPKAWRKVSRQVSMYHRNWLSNLRSERLLVQVETFLIGVWIWTWPTFARQDVDAGCLRRPELNRKVSWKCDRFPSFWFYQNNQVSLYTLLHGSVSLSTRWRVARSNLISHDSESQHLWYAARRLFYPLIFFVISLPLVSQTDNIVIFIFYSATWGILCIRGNIYNYFHRGFCLLGDRKCFLPPTPN